MDTLPEHEQLAHALVMAQPLVQWMVRQGIGHGVFAAAIKPLFLAAAMEDLNREERKLTDSALTLRSGLHRKDVHALREEASDSTSTLAKLGNTWSKPSPANQVFTRWVVDSLPEVLPFDGPPPSFASLVQSISRDIHHRAVLEELQRLGLIDVAEAQVTLRRQRFIPAPNQREKYDLFAAGVADHLHAGSDNINQENNPPHLEQSLFANGLTAESVNHLTEQARLLWQQVLREMTTTATPLCIQDTDSPESYRFRLGMFTYAAPESNQDPQP